MSEFDIIPKELLRHWIAIAPGAFCAADLTRDVMNQQLYINMLEELVSEGVIEYHGERRGWYRPRQVRLEKMDYKAAGGHPVDIWLPFGLSDMVSLYQGSIVIISGAPNSGKTGILLNIIKENQPKEWDIHYFNSEMSADELKIRLGNFYPAMRLEQWEFSAYNRSDNFQDVIFPGTNCLNIIDFLEVHDEFYKVGKAIKNIHDRLKGGVAIIALQKNPGSDTGLGGYRTLEVTRLALSVDYGRVKIVKAKNFKDPKKNPNGFMKNFKIAGGCNIRGEGKWYREKTSETDPTFEETEGLNG